MYVSLGTTMIPQEILNMSAYEFKGTINFVVFVTPIDLPCSDRGGSLGAVMESLVSDHYEFLYIFNYLPLFYTET